MRVWIGLVLLSGLLSGCSKPDSEFSYSRELNDLIPDARKQVVAVVKEHFGTPQQMVAWERYPVKFGGFSGKVKLSADPAYEPETSFPVEFETEPPADLANVQVRFLSGELEGKLLEVSGYDPETKVLTLQQPLEGKVATDDLVVLDPGHTLKYGQTLYREHCVHCHGVAGDGAGPTAEYLNPLPRDYRLGVFKFTSTTPRDKATATREDLVRTIRHGIPGTYMPSFMLLEEEEVDAIVEYIRWLALRGETEQIVIQAFKANFIQPFTIKDVELALKSKTLTRQEIEKNLETFIKEEFPSTFDTEATFLAEAWEAIDTPDQLLLPTTRYQSATEQLTEWLQQNQGSLSHGQVSAVQAAQDGENPTPGSLKIQWTGEASVAEQDQQIVWMSGANAGTVSKVASYDEASQQLTLAEAAPNASQAGDQFALVQSDLPPALKYVLAQGADLAQLKELASSQGQAVELTQYLENESIRRGRAFFISGGCIDCHGLYGEGNGPQTEDFQKNAKTGEYYNVVGLHDDWGNPIEPRNLTRGIYRGGRRPLDLYRRVVVGIKGTPMPPLNADKFLNDGDDYEAWDLVNYIYSVPHQNKSASPNPTSTAAAN